MSVLQGAFGLLALPALAWAISEDRKKVRPKIVVTGVLAQLLLALALLKIPLFHKFFLMLNSVVLALEESTRAGTSFVFGYLGGGTLPFDEKFPGASFVFGIQALPLILVISALSALFFYWGVLPVIVKAFSYVLQKILGLGGAAGLGAAANIFVGMVEAPLLVKPYIKEMTRSELFLIMTCGMATIAGTMMVLYASMLRQVIPDAMGHVLTASLISAPAAITIAALMVPETGQPTAGELTSPQRYTSSMDAITKGALDGVTLLINIIVMLITLVALVYLVNEILGVFPDIGGRPVTLQLVLGYLMIPLAWFMGIPWSEAATAGSLLGVKTVLNEFIAYRQLAELPPDALSARSDLIMTYALCGFANFGSLGIMIGGLGAMAPERRDEIVSLGLKAIVSGSLATCMTGAVAGIVGAF